MRSFIKTVLLTTLVAGTLDIIAACTHSYILNKRFPSKIFHYIAGGALGLETSLQGGTGVLLLGVFFHYLIAFLFTLFFFLVCRRLGLLSGNKYVTGFLYGIFVWLVMNLVVVPMSRIPARPFDVTNSIIGALILCFMIGIPISVSAHRYFKVAPANRR